MKGGRAGPKKRKVAGFMRAVLATNLRRTMEHRFKDSTNRAKALSALAGISMSTVQRLLAGESGATLDNIESLADALEVSVYQVLAPELDPDNPPIIKGATEAERRLYNQWRKAHLNEGVDQGSVP